MSKKIIKSSISGVLQHVFTAALTFVSIPIFIKQLGPEQYGLYSLLTILGNLNVIANLGLNTTLVKSLALQGKSRQSDYDIVVTIAFVLAISLPLTAVAFWLEHPVITKIMNISEAGYLSSHLLYKCILLANIVLLIGQTLVAILESQGKFHLTNGFQFIYNSIYWIGTIIVVKLGYNLDGVGIIALIASLCWIIILIVTCYRQWGAISTEGLRSNYRPTLKKQLSHGIKIFSGGLLGLIIEPTTKILTGNLIGIKEVGYLEIAYKLRTQFWGLIMKALAPILPVISGNASIINAKTTIINTQKNLLLFITPVTFIIINTLPYLLAIWLKEVNPDLISTVLFLTTSYVISSVAIPAYFAQLTFFPTTVILAHVCNLGLNLLITYIMYPLIGYTAIILGSSVAFLLSNQVNIYVINFRALKEYPSLSDCFRFLIVVFILFAASWLFLNFFAIGSLFVCACYSVYMLVTSILLFQFIGIDLIKSGKLSFTNNNHKL